MAGVCAPWRGGCPRPHASGCLWRGRAACSQPWDMLSCPWGWEGQSHSDKVTAPTQEGSSCGWASQVDLSTVTPTLGGRFYCTGGETEAEMEIPQGHPISSPPITLRLPGQLPRCHTALVTVSLSQAGIPFWNLPPTRHCFGPEGPG